MYWIWTLIITSGLYLYNLDVVKNNVARINFPENAECKSYHSMPFSSTMVIRIKGDTPKQCFFEKGFRVIFGKKEDLLEEQIEQRLPFYKDNRRYTANGLTPPTHILEKETQLKGLLMSVKLNLVDLHSGEIKWTNHSIQNILVTHLNHITTGSLFLILYVFMYCICRPLRKILNKHKKAQSYQAKYEKALESLRDENYLEGVDQLLECAKQSACLLTQCKAKTALKTFEKLQKKYREAELS